MADGQWTSWKIVDCPLLPAGLIDCDMSCLSQLKEILKEDGIDGTSTPDSGNPAFARRND